MVGPWLALARLLVKYWFAEGISSTSSKDAGLVPVAVNVVRVSFPKLGQKVRVHARLQIGFETHRTGYCFSSLARRAPPSGFLYEKMSNVDGQGHGHSTDLDAIDGPKWRLMVGDMSATR